MSLPLLGDQCVPATITNALRDAGHHVFVLREVLSIRAPDPIVLAKAQELDAVLVSLDGDFSDIVAYPPTEHGGIISIQLHNHPEIIPQVMTTLIAFLREHSDRDFYRGKLLLVEVHRIRIRG